MSKTAILYICTGRYDVFFPDFYQTAEQLFLNNHTKHYFVFTDSTTLTQQYKEHTNITFIHQNKLGWPYDTLMRYEMFLKSKHLFENFDYIFYLNANYVFKKPVGDEFLPLDNHEENGLVAVLHPYFYQEYSRYSGSRPYKYTYETNPASLAYIPECVYICGGVNGGVASAALKMFTELATRIQIDQNNGIIAVWHDESHHNRYVYELDYKVKLLPPDYAFPEGAGEQTHITCKMLLRDKENLYGHDFLRGITDIPISKDTITLKPKPSFIQKLTNIFAKK